MNQQNQQAKMTRDEARRLVESLRGHYGKTPPPEEMDFTWWPALREMRYDLAREAARDILVNSTEFLSVGLLRRRYREMANQRIQSVVPPQPPSGLSPAEYEAWQRGWKDAAVSGVKGTAELSTRGCHAIGRTPVDQKALTSSGPRPGFRPRVVTASPDVVEGVILTSSPLLKEGDS